MSQSLRIIFAGTPDFAAKHLEALLASQHQVVAVYTQPDRPAGRGKKLTPSPVKRLAQERDLSVFQPQTLKSAEAQAEMKCIDADIMVVVAYGLILPKTILSTPPHGCINVHGSILPKWRGAAPIQRAIWAGDSQTGVTIMQMDEGLDTGDMLHAVTVPINPDDTSATLYEKLAIIGPVALTTVLDNLFTLHPKAQDSSAATYAKKLSKEEAQINWHDDGFQIERNIRAFNPWPVAWLRVGQENVKVWQASVLQEAHNAAPGTVIRADKQGIVVATGTQPLRLETLQIPGKKALAAVDVINARKSWFEPGNILDENT